MVSANFHGGTIVANYPFDNKALGVSDTFGRPNPTLDNDVFEAMARNYSMAHANMRQSPCVGENFPDGITNGGMQGQQQQQQQIQLYEQRKEF